MMIVRRLKREPGHGAIPAGSRPRSSPFSLLLALSLALGGVVVLPGAAEEPGEIPAPAVDRFEPRARQQIAEERRRLESTLRSEAGPEARSAAWGRLGQIFYVYDLTQAAEICFANARDASPRTARWRYFLALVHEREGDLASAAVELESAVELSPADHAVVLRLADALFDLGRVNDAELRYRQALEIDGASAPALYGLGRTAAARGRHRDAVDLFERALALQPEAGSIHHQMGLAYRSLGDLDRARRHFERNTGSPLARKEPLVAEAMALVKSARILIQTGVDAARRGRYAEAIGFFERAVTADPESAEALNHLALAELEAGRRERAREHLERAVGLEPDTRDFRLTLGRLLAQDGDLAGAERHFRRAHEIDPRDVDTHLEWVTALARLQRTSEARAEAREVLGADSEHPRARLILGILNVERDPVAAKLDLEEVIAGSRADAAQKAEAYRYLAVLSERRGDAEQAEASHRMALELVPGSSEHLEALALFYGRRGRFLEAAEVYGEAIDAGADRLSIHFGQAMAHLLGGDDATALSGLEASTRRFPGDVGLAHLLARVLAASADRSVRDPGRAHDLALRVQRAEPSPDHVQTVAMALAALDRFDEAVEWQARAVSELEELGAEAAAEQARRRLDRLSRGEPIVSPWLAPAG